MGEVDALPAGVKLKKINQTFLQHKSCSCLYYLKTKTLCEVYVQ